LIQQADSPNPTTAPFTPSAVKVLVVSRSNYYGTGYLLSDLARYGFNVTWHAANIGTDYVTDPKTININQYDVVILHQTLTTGEQPATMTEAEVAHFTKTFSGVLIVTANSMMRNETSGNYYGFASSAMQNIEQRLGIDFTGWITPYKANGTFYRTSDLIRGLPDSVPFKTSSASDFQHPTITLKGATQLYNLTREGVSTHPKGITYYKNATGAVGIYINGIYEYKTEPQPEIPYYWGFCGGTYQQMNAANIELRAQLLGRLAAYALNKDFNAIIKPQPMAIFRVDDYVAGLSGDYANDANQTNSLQNLYDVLEEYNAPASLAFLANGFSSFPKTIQKAKDLNLQEKRCSLETHFRHEDYRTYSVSQIETLIENQFSDYATYGFEKFSVGIAPAGYYANNVYTAMANKGLYLLDLTASLPPGYEWWDLFVNESVILKGALNMAGNGVLFTQMPKDNIHYAYYSQRSKFALAIIKSAPTFYFHVQNPAMNEVGTWTIRTDYWNLTAEIPDVKFVTNQIFAQHFGKKWAAISNPSQSGNTITFEVNVDNVPTVTTIGKGMLWYCINAGQTIQSVKINGSDWHAFDDHSIRIPARNSQIEVTLGLPNVPQIREFDRQIRASNFDGNKLVFSVHSLIGTVSRTTIYCGVKGEPKIVLTTNGILSQTYNAASTELTLIVTHSGSAEVLIDWRILGDVNGDNKVCSLDLFQLGKAYGSDSSKPNWNPDCDFNWDGKIDDSDLTSVSSNYGKITP